jgi:hypothetical protein
VSNGLTPAQERRLIWVRTHSVAGSVLLGTGWGAMMWAILPLMGGGVPLRLALAGGNILFGPLFVLMVRRRPLSR